MARISCTELITAFSSPTDTLITASLYRLNASRAAPMLNRMLLYRLKTLVRRIVRQLRDETLTPRLPSPRRRRSSASRLDKPARIDGPAAGSGSGSSIDRGKDVIVRETVVRRP